MTATLGELIEFTRHQLSGLDSSLDSVSALASPLSATATSIALADGSSAAAGLVEIDLEQVRVKSASTVDASLEAWPFGRGYRGTRAVAHAAGAEVRFGPEWPASTVARELNGVLHEIYPSVYAVREHITTAPPLGGALDVPADAVGVISVWVEDPSNPDQWVREDRWDYNPDSTTIGRGLRIGGHRSAQRVRIVYATRPGTFDLTGALAQDFTTVTGLDARVSDLLALGVARRLAPFLDVSRLPVISATAEASANGRPAGGGASATRLLHSLFLSRLEQEASVLSKEHPIRVHRVR